MVKNCGKGAKRVTDMARPRKTAAEVAIKQAADEVVKPEKLEAPVADEIVAAYVDEAKEITPEQWAAIPVAEPADLGKKLAEALDAELVHEDADSVTLRKHDKLLSVTAMQGYAHALQVFKNYGF